MQTIVPIERHELLHRYLGLDPRDFPNAERLADTTLSLPLYPALSDAEVDAVCDALSRAGA
ncbi:DegT/DnrJ/EryC1/StrS aminotransferase family protein [compost metagenome]